VPHAGNTAYNPTDKSYVVTGSGENMWSTKDAFQFAWKTLESQALSERTPRE
jgi:hypothetical protein